MSHDPDIVQRLRALPLADCAALMIYALERDTDDDAVIDSAICLLIGVSDLMTSLDSSARILIARRMHAAATEIEDAMTLH